LEKGLEIDELGFDPDPEDATPEDSAVPWSGRDAEEVFVGNDAAARFTAAMPLAVVADSWEPALLGVLATGVDLEASEEQLWEFGNRCSGQNFWWHFYTTRRKSRLSAKTCAKGDSRRTVFAQIGPFHISVLNTWVLSWLSVTDQSWHSNPWWDGAPSWHLGLLLEEWEQVRYKEDLDRMRVGIECKKERCLQSGATRLNLDSSYLGQVWDAGLKWSAQKEFAQCWHLNGRKSTRRQEGCEHWRPTAKICWSRSGIRTGVDDDMAVGVERKMVKKKVRRGI
jgi:hypothetical protein